MSILVHPACVRPQRQVTFCNLNFCLMDRLPKVDIKDFKSIPAVDGALPAAGFGAGTYDAKDDDTYESSEV